MTCKNLSPLAGRESVSRQELIDDLWDAFKDGGFGIADTGSCRYRTYEGFGCAIGRLIQDVDYHVDLEPFSPKDIVSEGILPEISDGNCGFYARLQSIHDHAAGEKISLKEMIEKDLKYCDDLTLPWKD